MVGLGDLPGGNFASEAHGVSSDGSIVVGAGDDVNGTVAFIWTAGGGMVGLGGLPGVIFNSNTVDIAADSSDLEGSGNTNEAFRWTDGNPFFSRAEGVSSDGSVVVGQAHDGNDFVAFVWTDLDGMRSLKQVLETDYGLDLTGWTLGDCWGVSDDGTVLVGWGFNPNGDQEAWRAVLPSNTSEITNPKPFDKWIAGETDTIKWTETGWFAIKIKCVLNLDTPLEDTLLIEDGVVPDSTLYVWALPDTLLSYRSKIIIENEFDSTEIIESGVFRIKPYVITRLNSDSTYYAYKIERDKWGFGNNQSDMWPPSWYNQFNYQGD